MNFSTDVPPKDVPEKDDSIFESANYFKDVKPDDITQQLGGEVKSTEAVKELYNIPWFDTNDSLGAFMAAIPKELGNLTQGVQTYGFWESFLYLDGQAYDFWMFLANDCGMGLSVGLIAATVFTKALFAPNVLYS